MKTKIRKPDWLKIDISSNDYVKKMRVALKENQLHTVCEEAKCPNRGECWRSGEATVMILGDKCSRNCRFCAVENNPKQWLDQREPAKVARAIKSIGLNYCVITSVTRDDLTDGGAQIWAETILQIREYNPQTKIEVLIPDFQGRKEDLDKIISAAPEVLGHNLETVPQLYKKARPQADYQQSLDVLNYAKKNGQITKSGIMVGLGETNQQVISLMQDAGEAGCDLFTIGQYLQPTKNHLPVERYVTPGEFKDFEEAGLKIGFKQVIAGPLIRSSYKAKELYQAAVAN